MKTDTLVLYENLLPSKRISLKNRIFFCTSFSNNFLKNMSNQNDTTGCMLVFVNIFSPIVSCYLAWKLVHPSSFMGIIAFLIVWGILAYIGTVVGAGIAIMLTNNK